MEEKITAAQREAAQGQGLLDSQPNPVRSPMFRFSMLRSMMLFSPLEEVQL